MMAVKHDGLIVGTSKTGCAALGGAHSTNTMLCLGCCAPSARAACDGFSRYPGI